MKVISVVGVSGSGKTTTIEFLASKLSKEGFKVGSVKHIHHDSFSIDTEGTDTWRHIHAGARITVALAPKETVMIKKTSTIPDSLDEVIWLFEKENLDIVFIEGLHSLTAKRRDVPKIVAAKNLEDLMKTVKGTEPILAITGIIAKKKIESEISAPIIDLEREGDLLLQLVKSQIDSVKS
ncbi:MAG: molybdopterin-guanine dinucleotide biosynthesis protein B [Candidatus Bathyarchaeia archaeon]